MPRRLIEKSNVFPYHVYNRTSDKIFYPLNKEEIWNEACDLLRILSWAYGVKVHAFVLMSNHYHLLLSTPYENLSDCMRYFQSQLSRWIKEKTESERFSFSTRYKWTIIKDDIHYSMALRYLYQNPVRAKITTSPVTYPWSTLANKLGVNVFGCPCEPCDWSGAVPDDIEQFIDWVSYTPGEFENERIKRALKKRTFQLPKKINNDYKRDIKSLFCTK